RVTAEDGIRTRDLRFTKPLLYQLSYFGAESRKITSVGIRLKRLNIPPTMNRLEEILAAKRAEIERLKPRTAELDREAKARNDFRDFRSALQQGDGKLAIIAEVKKASPSAGVIAKSFEPVEIAKKYERDRANAISVLTDTKFFQGKLEYLADVRG